VVENLLYEGLTVLCAPAKFGKSWFVLNLCIAIATGKDYMAFRTQKADCLYYSLEDNKHRLKKRLETVLKGAKPPANISFIVEADKLGSGFLERAQEEIDRNPNIGLVVIDTLQKIRKAGGSNTDVYGHDYEEMSQLKKFAGKNKLAVVIVHHTRKMKDDDDIFNTVLGSGGIAGTADTTIILSRAKRFDEQSKLSVTGRDIEEREFMVRLDKQTFQWEMCGDAKEMEEKRRRDEYETDFVVRTVKALLKAQPYGWTGTATDLIKAAFDMFGETYGGTNTALGQSIKRWEQKLYYDGIDHKEKRTGKERKHNFYKRSYRPPQIGLFGDNDDD
jgi:RecA-family ATPase